MNRLLLVALIALPAIAAASFIRASVHDDMVMSDDMINEVNRSKTTWVAGRNARFEGVTVAMARKMMGTRLVHSEATTLLASGSIPASFDAREKWSKCVHPIRNQGQCGSCWAFGATEAFSDRICIATGGKTNVILSPEQLVACDTTDMGCQGGYLANAWQFMATNGVVSDSCLPYTSGDGSTPSCASTCTDSTDPFTKYTVDASSIVTPKDIASIQTAIMTNGPVEAGFTVYQDFMSYKSGIYKHVSGGVMGGHAIKIVGWGNEGGVDYWIVANSWGPAWGLSGFFNIAFGECGIEGNVIAGLPSL